MTPRRDSAEVATRMRARIEPPTRRHAGVDGWPIVLERAAHRRVARIPVADPSMLRP
jgi:hypothetical protein